MKIYLCALGALALSGAAVSQTYVHGYTTQSGTYVAPHYRSSPDSSTLNNWSTIGNVNPYTGQAGTRSPYSSYGALPSYSTPALPTFQCSYCASTTTPSGSSDNPY